MTFKKTLLLCVGVPVLVFALASTLLGWTLQRSNAAFGQYIDQDQAVENALRDMYAQGLQMGQALRNIVLDPENRQAYGNLESAQKQFSEAQARLVRLTDATPQQASVARLQPLANQLFQQQKAVLDKAASDVAGARGLLVSSETPAWRALRGALLEDIDAHGKAIREQFSQGREQVIRLTLLSAALVGLAMLVAGFFTWSLLRTVNRELGAEPSALRDAMSAVASGDLTIRLGAGAAASVDAKAQPSVAAALNTMVGRLAGSIRQVNHSAQEIRVVSGEIEAGNHDLSARTEQAASNLQQTAASMEEMASAIQHSAESVREATQLAQAAAHKAQQGGEVVGDVIRTMDAINAASSKISDIIGVIDGIAFQTNILALNAAVEAARAGEQGRGFAVVAGEVRTLAQRTTQAAKEIKALIVNSVDQASAGAEQVQRAGQAMQDIVASVQRVGAIISSVSDTTKEQAEGVNQINAAIANLDQMTQQNAALVEESAAGASGMSGQARQLAEVVSSFRLSAA